MHILIIPSWYKEERNPVKGSFFEEQARALMRKGSQAGIFHVGFKAFSDPSKCTVKKFNDNGLNTFQFDVKAMVPYLHGFNYWYLGVKAYKRFKEYVKEFGRPDVIHAHSVFWGGIAASYISKRTGIPFVITEHLTDFITVKLGSADKKAAVDVFTGSAGNIVVSSSFREKLALTLKLPEGKFNVIHNMVDPMFFNESRVLDKTISAPVFFANSFISERKNIDLIIRAFKTVLKKYPRAVLLIGGDAVREKDKRYKEELFRLRTELKMEKEVVFLGALSREMVFENIARSHIFLSASKFETFGVVLIEAMAGGIPVIATDSFGPRDIINEKNGILVRSFSEDEFSDAMIKVSEDYGKYNSNEIINYCKTKFSEEVIISKLMNIYSHVI